MRAVKQGSPQSLWDAPSNTFASMAAARPLAHASPRDGGLQRGMPLHTGGNACSPQSGKAGDGCCHARGRARDGRSNQGTGGSGCTCERGRQLSATCDPGCVLLHGTRACCCHGGMGSRQRGGGWPDKGTHGDLLRAPPSLPVSAVDALSGRRPHAGVACQRRPRGRADQRRRGRRGGPHLLIQAGQDGEAIAPGYRKPRGGQERSPRRQHGGLSAARHMDGGLMQPSSRRHRQQRTPCCLRRAAPLVVGVEAAVACAARAPLVPPLWIVHADALLLRPERTLARQAPWRAPGRSTSG